MDFLWRKDYQRVVLYIVTVVSVLAVLKYLLPYFLPLLLALLIVVPLQRSYRKRENRQRTHRKKHNGNGRSFMAGGILFGIILLAALLLVGAGTFLVSKARELMRDMESLTESVTRIISDICARAEVFFGLQSGFLEEWIFEKLKTFGGGLTQNGSGLLAGSFRYAAVLGRTVTFMVVSFICVVLFAREIDSWEQGLLRLATIEPAIDRILSIIIRIGKKLGRMIKAYLRTQGIILLCISVAATGGLFLGGMSEAWFYGVLAGVMDFLPFIGTGIVLIPIAVVSLIRGNLMGGIIVMITYFFCVLIRELLEPRLLGNGMKFSPVAILISVYAGVMFYGLGGVILGPITLMILVELGKEIFT